MVERRLIDKNVLLDGLREWKNDDPYRTLRWPWERWVRDVGIRVLEIVVKQMSPVDAVEVVRCKDCGYGGLCGAEIACNHPAYAQNEGVWSYDPEFFCAYGERRPE